MPLWLLSLKNPRHAERPWALHQRRSMCLAAQKGWIGIHLRTVLATLAACLRSLAAHRTGGTDKLHCCYEPQQLFQNTNPTIILLSPRTIQQRHHCQRNPLKKSMQTHPLLSFLLTCTCLSWSWPLRLFSLIHRKKTAGQLPLRVK